MISLWILDWGVFFSIISQGKVEEIFNSKPEERRAIFEEAAGVLKFKTRRKETESKLVQT